jgi:hypothetical protein
MRALVVGPQELIGLIFLSGCEVRPRPVLGTSMFVMLLPGTAVFLHCSGCEHSPRLARGAKCALRQRLKGVTLVSCSGCEYCPHLVPGADVHVL